MTANRAIERDTRSPVTARIWGRTRKALESLGKAEKFAHTTLIGDTAEILAGAIHCARCGEPVPAVMGDCTGRPLRAWVADATTAVYRQKCKDHQPVLVGAGNGSRAATEPQEAAPVLVAANSAPATTVAHLRETVPGVVTASEIPGPAAVFRAGPEIDCLHESFRGVKGVCPDCKQWVGGKR